MPQDLLTMDPQLLPNDQILSASCPMSLQPGGTVHYKRTRQQLNERDGKREDENNTPLFRGGKVQTNALRDEYTQDNGELGEDSDVSLYTHGCNLG